jgi:trans-aconitate 2-methyltransferase
VGQPAHALFGIRAPDYLLAEGKRVEDRNQTRSGQWNAEDYARNSSAQECWANELMSKLSLKGYESLLDIGCGDGRITDEIARRLPSGSVVGIDSSEAMIRLASKSFVRENLSFIAMGATDIHLNRMFDIAFSSATLHWIADHQAVLSGLRKHLNRDARILFQMGGRGNAAEMIRVVDQMTASGKWAGYFEGFDFPYHFYDIGDYEKWLPAAGYAAQRIELISKDMVHRNADELKGWLRTTWFPYTDRLPGDQRELFLAELAGGYLKMNPVDSKGQTHVKMVRLEVEAKIL